MVGILFLAGVLVTGSANALNQLLEKDSDALMKRTASRPVAKGTMSVEEAGFFAFITGTLGIMLLQYYFNWTSALLALLSLVIYAWVYTPMKKVNSLAVLIGALPGALPCLIGWTAGNEHMNTLQSWGTFFIQFFWQFPHFWAIAWISHEDYKNAGFKLLPSTIGPSKFTAVQTVIYSCILIPIGFLPYFLHISGLTSFYIILACNLVMVYLSIGLLLKQTKLKARLVMFGSYFYLVIVYFAMLFDKVSL